MFKVCMYTYLVKMINAENSESLTIYTIGLKLLLSTKICILLYSYYGIIYKSNGEEFF